MTKDIHTFQTPGYDIRLYLSYQTTLLCFDGISVVVCMYTWCMIQQYFGGGFV